MIHLKATPPQLDLNGEVAGMVADLTVFRTRRQTSTLCVPARRVAPNRELSPRQNSK